MKVIVTHKSPDLDAITSVWVIKRFLNGWENAKVTYVNAGDRINLTSEKISPEDYTQAIEIIGEDEVIHVDTGLGALDHHQTSSDKVCGASLAWSFVKNSTENKTKTEKIAAVDRIIRVVIDYDHFKESLRPEADADYQDFSLDGILEGLKYQQQGNDDFYTDFIMGCLDALVYEFENKIWAEKEIAENGHEFNTSFGKGLGVETLNDTFLKLAQIKGFGVVARKDPNTGFVRIKASPKTEIDLTTSYNELRKLDPEATWFLHVSKKMLLNGTSKNPNMRPTKLTLSDIIGVLEKI